MAAKNVILRKQIAGVLYDLYPQTAFAQVVNSDNKDLNAIVKELTDAIALKATGADLTALQTKFDNLIQDAPAAYDTLKEISDYIATHTSEYEALKSLTADKVSKKEGYDLSKNDFTDELKAKLDDLYTKAQLDTKFDTLTKADEANATKIAANTTAITTLNGADTVEGSVAYQIKAAKTTIDASVAEVKKTADANKTAIDTLNGDEATAGSVANTVKTAIDKVNTATGDLEKRVAANETKIAKKGTVYAAAEKPADLTENDLWIYIPEAVPGV